MRMNWKKLDPFYWYIWVMVKDFFKASLEDYEEEFVQDNSKKHRKIQWVNFVAAILVTYSLASMSLEEIKALISALLSPVVVTGGAWFAISFGAIPAKLLHLSMSITFWMYAGFKVSLTTMCIALTFIMPVTMWPVIWFIYLAIDICCIMYDTADGLKAGLDEMALKHSKAALLFFEKHK